MGLISVFLDDRACSYVSRRFLRTGIIARATIDAAADDAFTFRDSSFESSRKLPNIIADAALDGSARDSINSSIAARGIETSETAVKLRSFTISVDAAVSTIPRSAFSDSGSATISIAAYNSSADCSFAGSTSLRSFRSSEAEIAKAL